MYPFDHIALAYLAQLSNIEQLPAVTHLLPVDKSIGANKHQNKITKNNIRKLCGKRETAFYVPKNAGHYDHT
ncbi:hypothetical protein JCM15765_35910 [Paradesulfitobacterium aromaticivorans]